MILNRRGFISGLISAIAAPAIVRIDNIMPVISWRRLSNYPLGMDEITREAVRLFYNSNLYIQNINDQYDIAFGSKFIVGTQLRIRLPKDYHA